MGEGKKLYRNDKEGWIFGICAGLEDYFGIDATILRLLIVVVSLFSGNFFLVCVFYGLAGVIIPDRPGSVGEGTEGSYYAKSKKVQEFDLEDIQKDEVREDTPTTSDKPLEKVEEEAEDNEKPLDKDYLVKINDLGNREEVSDTNLEEDGKVKEDKKL